MDNEYINKTGKTAEYFFRTKWVHAECVCVIICNSIPSKFQRQLLLPG